MSGEISILGGYSGAFLVPIAPSLGSISGLRTYFASVSSAFAASPNTLNLNDLDIATAHDYTLLSGAAAEFLELSNTDSAGVVAAGVVTTGLYAVPATVVVLVVQAPGTYSIAGADLTNFVLFSAASNVTYTVSSPSLDGASIIAAGGANFINITFDASVYAVSAGADTVNFIGLGNDTLLAQSGANDDVLIQEGSSTITANGDATVSMTFTKQAGANLYFINSSVASQTIFSGAYTQAGGASVFAPNSVTAFGGAGGGYFVGGLAGNNSLVGGAGVTTLQGGGAGDLLEVTGGATAQAGGGNVLFAGNANETLIATATTQDNTFNIGGQYTGKGYVITSGVVSSAGAGAQTYFLGNAGSETITGSLAATFNVYDVINDSTSGGGHYVITNFTAADHSVMYLSGPATGTQGDASIAYLGPGPGSFSASTMLELSDGTSILLLGEAPSAIFTDTLPASNGAITGIGVM